MNRTPRRWPGLLAALVALLAVGPSPALAQCEESVGAGDEYCESLPSAGGTQGTRQPARGGGDTPPRTRRELDRAGAGAVEKVQSPRTARRTPETGTAAPSSDGSGSDGSFLPYLLIGLSIALIAGALVRRVSTSED